ncbi:TPA: hypothetical protein ACH3X1_013350 [Trebouxia sp. C0004]
MSGEKLSLEQFSALLKNIDSGLGLAASQLWKEGVNTEALLRKLTKQDMHMAGINLGNRVLIYDHFHPTDAGHLQTVVVDKTARKVAQLAQLVQGPPPSFDELEAYLFRHSDVKLPVSDAKYYSLVAANEALMSQIEPASASGAEALAEVVTTALRMQYEPVEDEISLAGVVDMLLWHIWRCIDMYDQGPKLGMRRKRNCAEDSATVKGKRPDFFLLSSRALLFKGEDKTSEAELEKALEELSTKLKEWGAAVHGKVEYLLCYACAGSQFQMCAMRLGTPGAFRFRRPLSLVTLEDRLQIVWIAVQSYWIMKAQAEQLPAVLLPIGRTEITTFSKAPHASQNGKEYIVDLEPVGQPVLSKHFDQRPQSSGELKKSIRYAPLLASGSYLSLLIAIAKELPVNELM